MPSIERAYKTDQENGMVCYVSTKTDRVRGDEKNKKLLKSADSANYSDVN